ncbi:MAG: phosphatase PAP2 family protein [Solirubrobacteraceae bacterium]|nr:phosphatase PAP2 family protein [Solirubrobacteraceae bacterium]
MDRVSRLSARTLAVLVAVGCFVAVLVLRLWLKWVGPLPGDRWAEHHLEGVALEQPWTDLGAFFSVIGGPAVASLTALVALWFAWRAGGWLAAAFVALACAGVVANVLLKVLSGPTPLMILKYGDPQPGLNYPSGHTVYAVVMFGSLAWLAWARGRRDLAVVLVVLIAAMGPARVLTDAHFVSDVVAGYLVGFGWLLCAALVTGAGGVSPRIAIHQRIVRSSA